MGELWNRVQSGRTDYEYRVVRAKEKVPKLNAKKFMEDIDNMVIILDELRDEPLSVKETLERLDELAKIVNAYKIR